MAQSQDLNIILESQSQLQALFVERMQEMESELKKANSPSSATTTSSLAADYFKFKEFVLAALRAIQSQISLLITNLEKMEVHKRRKILLIHGIPDGKDEDTMTLVTDTIVNRLKISDFCSTDISRCHRMGRSVAQDRPRPILVKVGAIEVRNRIWFAKTQLRGSGITLSEFLTKSRHEIFMAARQKFGVNKCWTRDGSVFVLGADEKTRHRINSTSELDKIAVTAGGVRAQPKVVKEPAVPSIRPRRNPCTNKK